MSILHYFFDLSTYSRSLVRGALTNNEVIDNIEHDRRNRYKEKRNGKDTIQKYI